MMMLSWRSRSLIAFRVRALRDLGARHQCAAGRGSAAPPSQAAASRRRPLPSQPAEEAPVERTLSHRPTVGCQVVRAYSAGRRHSHALGQHVAEEARDRNGAARVRRFRRTEQQMAVHVSHGFGDVKPPAQEVDALGAQGPELARAQAAVPRGEHQRAEARVDGVGQGGELLR